MYYEDYIDELREMIRKLCKHYMVSDGTGWVPWGWDDKATAAGIREAEELVKRDYYLR